MKYSLITAALAAPVVFAAPAKRQDSNIDPVVLQFALTLEHLENVFYKQVLQQFSQADFQAAGYGANYYTNLRYIASDEQSHVQLLTSALQAAGQTPVAACTYNFPYTDVNSFITLSSIIEGVGTSAYLGGAPLITSKDYLTVAGSILVTEALHTSLQRSAVNEVAAANPYGTPLDPTSVYTLAAAFIVSCPASNAPLPFTPFPSLALNTMAGTCELPDCSSKQFLKKRDWNTWEPMTVTRSAYGEHKPTATYAPPEPTMTSKPEPEHGNGGGMGSGGAPKNSPALMAGATASFTAATMIPAGSYLTFVSGLSVVSVAATIDGMSASAAIPMEAMGQSYVFITSAMAAGNKLDGTTILFGPAILEVTPGAPMIDFSQQ